jgi:DNA-binding response OmpR family regulator
MPMYDTVGSESVVALVYADGSPEHLSTFRRLFEGTDESSYSFKVHYCNGVANIGPQLANAQQAIIILGSTLNERDKFQACYGFGPESEYSIPIVVLGLELGAPQLIEYFELGVSDYIMEPVKQSELLAKVHNILKKTAQTPSSPLFQNRYERLGIIGEGGFGHVYLSLDHGKTPPEKVALKFYTIEVEDTNFRSRYLQEAFQLSRLNHPNIVRLLDFGKTETDYFLVTEFVDGTTLEDVMANHGTLSEVQAALVGYYVGNALNHMSRASIVHRDLGPRNIMLTHEGDVKVIDFGLAKTHMAATLSTDDLFQGTPYYIAPEHILGEDVDTKTDLYSLAITIYFMLTGKFPFDGKDAQEVLEAHMSSTPVPLIELAPDLDEGFSEIISQSFERSPEDRPELPDFIRIMKAIIDAGAE